MIEAHFGLKKLPFPRDIKTQAMFESFDLRESAARLDYIRQYRGILCLTGEPGSGKTTVVRRFVDGLNPQSFVHCYTPHATVSRSELYRQINTLLRLPNRIHKSDLFTQIQAAILDMYHHQGKVTCIVLDEVQLMDHQTLREIVLMTNFELDSKLPFILLLVGQPEFKETLNRQIHEPLKQRVNIRYHMAGLSRDEAKEYVLYHLKLAGRSEPLFMEASFDVIHQLTHGLPRNIGKICLAAMQLAMSRQVKTIDGDLVLQVAGEI